MPPADLAAAAANPAVAKDTGPKDSPVLGMVAAIGAFGMLSTMSLFAKLLSETHHVIEIAFWRNLLAVIPFLVAIVFFRQRQILKIHSKPGVVFTRSVVATGSILCVFGAFALLPLADATALVFTSALFVPVLGFFFLGERVGRFRWSAVIVGFVGVLLVAQPGGEWNLFGVALGLAGAFFNAVLGTMLRLLGRTENPATLTFYLVLTGVLLLAPFMPFIGKMPAQNEIGLLLGLGASGIAMQLLITTAFKYAPAALASVFSYTQIVWATLYGWALFGMWPAANILIGAAVIIGSSIVVILRERYLARKGALPREPAVGA
jgi:drug/metabolite transporter (DMT)-like permease